MVYIKKHQINLIKYLLVVALTLSMAFSPFSALETKAANSSLASQIQRYHVGENATVMFIGDSYTYGFIPGKRQRSWAAIIGNEIGADKYIVAAQSGSGFLQKSYYLNLSYEDLMCYAISNCRNPQAIEKVVLLGGYNDKTTAYNTIYAYGSHFIQTAHKLCPNAIVYIGMPAASVKPDLNKAIQSTVLPAYRKAARDNGAVFIEHLDDILNKHRENFSSDGKHPNENGQDMLAAAVKNAMNTLPNNQVVQIGNSYRYYTGGQLNPNVSGLINYGNNWYYLKNGISDNTKQLYTFTNGRVYYLSGGKIDRTFTGVFSYNNILNYIENGIVSDTYTGLGKYGSDYLYFRNGVYQPRANLLASYGNNNYYLVRNGKIDRKFTGLYKYNGKWYYVKNGAWDRNYSNLVKYDSSWYYVDSGRIKWSGATLSQVNHSGRFFYVKNGKLNTNYTGLCSYNNKKYYVKKGICQNGYNGVVTISGKKYFIKNGIALNA